MCPQQHLRGNWLSRRLCNRVILDYPKRHMQSFWNNVSKLDKFEFFNSYCWGVGYLWDSLFTTNSLSRILTKHSQ